MKRKHEDRLRLTPQERAVLGAIRAGGETGVTFASLLRDVAAALGREVKPKSVRRAIYAADEKLRVRVKRQIESVFRQDPQDISRNVVHYRFVGEMPSA